MLTAYHVGPGTIWFDGLPYQYVPGTAIQLHNGEPPPNTTYADLLMFQIYPEPPLPPLEIASLPPLVATPVIMVGSGLNRGPAYSDPLLPDGYYWGSGAEHALGHQCRVGHSACGGGRDMGVRNLVRPGQLGP